MSAEERVTNRERAEQDPRAHREIDRYHERSLKIIKKMIIKYSSPR